MQDLLSLGDSYNFAGGCMSAAPHSPHRAPPGQCRPHVATRTFLPPLRKPRRLGPGDGNVAGHRAPGVSPRSCAPGAPPQASAVTMAAIPVAPSHVPAPHPRPAPRPPPQGELREQPRAGAHTHVKFWAPGSLAPGRKLRTTARGRFRRPRWVAQPSPLPVSLGGWHRPAVPFKALD